MNLMNVYMNYLVDKRSDSSYNITVIKRGVPNEKTI